MRCLASPSHCSCIDFLFHSRFTSRMCVLYITSLTKAGNDVERNGWYKNFGAKNKYKGKLTHPLSLFLWFISEIFSAVVSWGQQIGTDRRRKFYDQIYDGNILHPKALCRKIESGAKDNQHRRRKVDTEEWEKMTKEIRKIGRGRWWGKEMQPRTGFTKYCSHDRNVQSR